MHMCGSVCQSCIPVIYTNRSLSQLEVRMSTRKRQNIINSARSGGDTTSLDNEATSCCYSIAILPRSGAHLVSPCEVSAMDPCLSISVFGGRTAITSNVPANQEYYTSHPRTLDKPTNTNDPAGSNRNEESTTMESLSS